MWLETTSRTERRRTIVLAMTCLAMGLLAAPFRPGIVLGESMAPTFHSGQVFVSARVNDQDVLRRGDVVLVSLNGQLLLKRIYAVGGQRVWGIGSGGVSGTVERVVSPREFFALRRLMSCHPGLGELVQQTVPDGYVFLLGDSSENSLDSRHFGPVPVESIRARVVVTDLFCLWGPAGAGPQVALAQETSAPADR